MIKTMNSSNNRADISIKLATADKLIKSALLNGNSIKIDNPNMICKSLIEKISDKNIDALVSKIHKLKQTNDMIIYILSDISSEISRYKILFLEKIIFDSNKYIINGRFLSLIESISKKNNNETNLESNAVSDEDKKMLKNMIHALINIVTVDIIELLMQYNCEHLIFTIATETKNKNISEYIKSIKHTLKNENIKKLLNEI